MKKCFLAHAVYEIMAKSHLGMCVKDAFISCEIISSENDEYLEII